MHISLYFIVFRLNRQTQVLFKEIAIKGKFRYVSTRTLFPVEALKFHNIHLIQCSVNRGILLNTAIYNAVVMGQVKMSETFHFYS